MSRCHGDCRARCRRLQFKRLLQPIAEISTIRTTVRCSERGRCVTPPVRLGRASRTGDGISATASADRPRRRLPVESVAGPDVAQRPSCQDAEIRSRPIPLKNSPTGRFGDSSALATLADQVAVSSGEALAFRPGDACPVVVIGVNHFAGLRRFCAAAARSNSSRAPLGPRMRRRRNFRIRFR